ncbi:Protein of unknown function [Gryllus bimaculatus]|nr:Protein of unknown function [Gryllus bimaculatus]
MVCQFCAKFFEYKKKKMLVYNIVHFCVDSLNNIFKYFSNVDFLMSKHGSTSGELLFDVTNEETIRKRINDIPPPTANVFSSECYFFNLYILLHLRII